MSQSLSWSQNVFLPSSHSHCRGENAFIVLQLLCMSKCVYHMCTILHEPFQTSKCTYKMSTIFTQPFWKQKCVFWTSPILTQSLQCISRTFTILTQPFQKSKRVYQTSNHITQPFLISKRVYETCTIPTRPFTRPHKTLTHVIYRIAGNFRGRELPQIGEIYDFRGENFCGKNFHELLACVVLKDATPQNFAQNTFANSHKTVKFVKVF